MTIRTCLLLLCALLGYAQTAKSEDLNVAKDSFLVHLLNNFEFVAERNELPLRVRVFRLRDLGECDGWPNRCPRETLFIAVSTFDESPDQRLYILPKTLGWTFNNWSDLPSENDTDPSVEFKASAQTPDKDRGGPKLLRRTYKIRVNPHSGSIALVKNE